MEYWDALQAAIQTDQTGMVPVATALNLADVALGSCARLYLCEMWRQPRPPVGYWNSLHTYAGPGPNYEPLRLMSTHAKWPSAKGININMMPFVLGDPTTIPAEYRSYYSLLQMCPLLDHQYGKVGYLTINEGHVEAGCTQRRPGGCELVDTAIVVTCQSCAASGMHAAQSGRIVESPHNCCHIHACAYRRVTIDKLTAAIFRTTRRVSADGPRCWLKVRSRSCTTTQRRFRCGPLHRAPDTAAWRDIHGFHCVGHNTRVGLSSCTRFVIH